MTDVFDSSELDSLLIDIESKSITDKIKSFYDKISSTDDILLQSQITNKLLLNVIRVLQEREEPTINEPLLWSSLSIIISPLTPTEIIPARGDSEIYIETVLVYSVYPCRFYIGTSVTPAVNLITHIVQGGIELSLTKIFPVGTAIEIAAAPAAIPNFIGGEVNVTVMGEYRKIRRYI